MEQILGILIFFGLMILVPILYVRRRKNRRDDGGYDDCGDYDDGDD